MPHYISLMRWTSQGMAGLPAWRERVEEGERIIEAAGGSLIGVYVTLGRYDVVEIFEAPDDEKAAEILMKLQRHGAEHAPPLGVGLWATRLPATELTHPPVTSP
jgi:uncharacterized protein with GYD domain